MTRSSDIERILSHLGASDMRYHEFEARADPTQAQANWRLVGSATGREHPDRAEESGSASPRFVEREVEFSEVPEPAMVPPADGPRAWAEPQSRSAQPPGTTVPLQRLFARLRGEADDGAAAARTSSPQPGGASGSPLSRVFRRLS